MRRAIATEKQPESWLMRVEAGGHGVVVDEALTRSERADEFLLMGLRLAEGIDPARFAALAGRQLDARRIATLRDDGFIEIDALGRAARDARGLPGARRDRGGSGGVTAKRAREISYGVSALEFTNEVQQLNVLSGKSIKGSRY